jgi:hypothetical protein
MLSFVNMIFGMHAESKSGSELISEVALTLVLASLHPRTEWRREIPVHIAPQQVRLLPQTPFLVGWSVLMYSDVLSDTTNQGRMTFSFTKIQLKARVGCDVRDGHSLQVQPTVIQASDLSWFELLGLEYMIH